MMKQDKSFEKFVAMSQFLGLVFLVCAGVIFVFGLSNGEDRNADASFCQHQGGFYFEPSRENYNQGLCGFIYDNHYSMYDIETLKEDIELLNHKKGDKCFICWSDIDCELDTLTKIDNGTRRHERC